MNYHFSQLDVRPWHLVNLFIHLINAILVWWLTLLILSSPVMKDQKIAEQKKFYAFAVALLFVSHPLATQSVTYIVQRMTSLVTVFYLLTVSLYTCGRMTKRGWIIKALFFAGALISAFLAMRTKENAFTLPFAMLLFEFFFIRTGKLRINFKDYWVILLPFVLLGMALVIPLKHSFDIFRPIVPIGHPESVLTPYYYLLTQFSVIVKYIQLLFVPLNLNLDYDFPVSSSFFQFRTIAGFLVLVSLIFLAVYFFNKHRIISFGIFWFFITLSVESSIIPITDVIVEHRTYLPSFGFFLVIIFLLSLVLQYKSKWIAVGLLVVMAGISSYLTYERNKVWKNDLILWTDVISKSPGKARAITNRGLAFAARGQWESAIEDFSRALQLDSLTPLTLISRGLAYKNVGQFENAVADYTRAISIDTTNLIAFVNRGNCYFDLGESEMAIQDFNRALTLDPGNTESYSNRCAVYLKTGNLEAAKNDIGHAILLDPGNYNAYINRGAVNERLNIPDSAIADYTRAIKLKPDLTKAFVDRAAVYLRSGNLENALADYSRAIEIEPGCTEAWFNRGVVYSNLGLRDRAIEDYTRFIALAPDNKLGYFNRGLTYGKKGNFELAIDDFNKALQIDPDFTLALQNREVAIRKLKK
jgi:tetratricopeptide (TPR) repeat protein